MNYANKLQKSILNRAVAAVESFDTKILVEQTLESNPQELAEIFSRIADQSLDDLELTGLSLHGEQRIVLKIILESLWLHGIAVGLELNNPCPGEQKPN